MKAKFVRKQRETKTNIYSFYFLPDHKVSFIAGQFTELTLAGAGKHWFTLSSSPDNQQLSITTRLTASQFKNRLAELKAGEIVNMAEPMGDFVLPKDTTIPILMVAGGIGITPFLSILAHNLVDNAGYNLNLLYGTSSSDDFIDLKPYRSLLGSFKKLTRRITSEDILAIANRLNEPYIYTSGPEPMVETFVKELKASGVPTSRLAGDYFPGYV